MKLVYIRIRGSKDKIKRLREGISFSRYVYRKGNMPICPEIFLEIATGLSELRGDKNKLLKTKERLISKCDEIWDIVIDNKKDNEPAFQNYMLVPIKTFEFKGDTYVQAKK